MLEQEIASIIKYTLDEAENPSPYYYEVPEDFAVPAAYFPTPEISTRGETFLTYAIEYVWFIKFFHNTTQEAYSLAFKALSAIKGNKNLIPLIDTEGETTGEYFRIKDPSLNKIDRGAVQLQIEWTSRRPYNTEKQVKMQSFEIENWRTPDIYTERIIPAAYAAAISHFATDYPHQKTASAATQILP